MKYPKKYQNFYFITTILKQPGKKYIFMRNHCALIYI